MKNLILTACLGLLSLASCHTPSSPFKDKMHESMQASLHWLSDSTGIWETAGWWNSANVLTATIRYAGVTGDTTLWPVIEEVYAKASHYPVAVDSTGTTRYADGFINDYYDDEGWWALAWIDAYRLTGQEKYLGMAESIFADMTTGWSDACGGGIFWKKNPFHYKNSIANNLFSLTAARLYESTGKASYRDWLEKNVAWYLQTGMVNRDIYQVEDGTTDDCRPNRGAHYTYNQGVAIAVLGEMYRLTKESSYLDLATQIADATIGTELVTEGGILREMRPEIADSNDGVQFKGIFIRHLAFLYELTQKEAYKNFILRNAESIVATNYDAATGSFGCYWEGPLQRIGPAANASALECVIEGYALSR